MSGGSARRRAQRAVALAGAAGAALALVACGSGGGSDSSSTAASEKAADAQTLNYALARELTAVAIYGRGLPVLRGAPRALAEQFRAQDQEHVDALTKSVRGLGGQTDAVAPAAPTRGPARTPAELLSLAYRQTNSTINAHEREIGELTTAWPRVLLAAIAANEAQQLVLLRQRLGARGLDAVPEAFESGRTPAP